MTHARRPLTRFNRLGLFGIATLAWLALALAVRNDAPEYGGLGLALWHMTDYFTNTTAILVAGLFTAFALSVTQPIASRHLGMVTLSVMLVVVVYWPILYPVHPPRPGKEALNLLFHAIVPALVVAYYAGFAVKGTMTRRDPVTWMAYPLGYTGFVLIRGLTTGHYPYFFFDPAKVGVVQVAMNIVIIGLVYFAASHTLVWVDQRSTRKA